MATIAPYHDYSVILTSMTMYTLFSNFAKSERQQIRGDVNVIELIPTSSVLHVWMQKWTSYWNWTQFAKRYRKSKMVGYVLVTDLGVSGKTTYLGRGSNAIRRRRLASRRTNIDPDGWRRWVLGCRIYSRPLLWRFARHHAVGRRSIVSSSRRIILICTGISDNHAVVIARSVWGCDLSRPVAG